MSFVFVFVVVETLTDTDTKSDGKTGRQGCSLVAALKKKANEKSVLLYCLQMRLESGVSPWFSEHVWSHHRFMSIL